MNIQLLAFIQNLRAPELILIFLVVLLLFGAKRLPELFKSFGKSIKEFKKATSDIENDVRNAMDAEDEPTPAAQAESKKVTNGARLSSGPETEKAIKGALKPSPEVKKYLVDLLTSKFGVKF